jgi:Protein of unknown function (DUF3175)
LNFNSISIVRLHRASWTAGHGVTARRHALAPAFPEQVRSPHLQESRKEIHMTIGKTTRKWSASVTEHSDALDLDDGIFESEDPKQIAASLKRSAEHSRRRKGTAFQSAMSMLNFYINRAGKNLSSTHKTVLERAKDALREEFGKNGHKGKTAKHQ